MAKVSDEEVAEIRALQKSFSDLSLQLGELSVQKILLEDAARDFAAQQRDLLQKLQAKYGVGTVDTGTGEFTPSGQ